MKLQNNPNLPLTARLNCIQMSEKVTAKRVILRISHVPTLASSTRSFPHLPPSPPPPIQGCAAQHGVLFILPESGKGIKITSGRRVIVQTKPCECFLNCDIPHCNDATVRTVFFLFFSVFIFVTF